MNPNICIVFNGGAVGDFFTMLINEQMNAIEIIVDNKGTVINCPGDFKNTCEDFHHNEDIKIFDNIKFNSVVNTHHCNEEIIKLFPYCKFYYIDDSACHNVTIDAFILKRLNHKYKNLIEYFNEGNTSIKDPSKIMVSDEDVKKVMFKDWKRNILFWKQLGIQQVNIQDIVNKEKCRHTIENIINCKIDYNKFSNTYNQYVSKNIDMIERING